MVFRSCPVLFGNIEDRGSKRRLESAGLAKDRLSGILSLMVARVRRGRWSQIGFGRFTLDDHLHHA